MSKHKLTEAERFWRRVDKSADCWQWTGATKPDGYGMFSKEFTKATGRKMITAHRYAWEVTNGPVPEGLFTDHLCHNRGCVNPFHLRLVTRQQNNEHRKGANVDNRSSGVLGVHGTPSGRWVAAVNHGGKSFNAGTHDTIAEAEAAVIALRLQIFTHNDKDKTRLSEARQAVQNVRKAHIWQCVAELEALIAA